jgi:hypothetical protein
MSTSAAMDVHGTSAAHTPKYDLCNIMAAEVGAFFKQPKNFIMYVTVRNQERLDQLMYAFDYKTMEFYTMDINGYGSSIEPEKFVPAYPGDVGPDDPYAFVLNVAMVEVGFNIKTRDYWPIDDPDWPIASERPLDIELTFTESDVFEGGFNGCSGGWTNKSVPKVTMTSEVVTAARALVSMSTSEVVTAARALVSMSTSVAAKTRSKSAARALKHDLCNIMAVKMGGDPQPQTNLLVYVTEKDVDRDLSRFQTIYDFDYKNMKVSALEPHHAPFIFFDDDSIDEEERDEDVEYAKRCGLERYEKTWREQANARAREYGELVYYHRDLDEKDLEQVEYSPNMFILHAHHDVLINIKTRKYEILNWLQTTPPPTDMKKEIIFTDCDLDNTNFELDNMGRLIKVAPS